MVNCKWYYRRQWRKGNENSHIPHRNGWDVSLANLEIHRFKRRIVNWHWFLPPHIVLFNFAIRPKSKYIRMYTLHTRLIFHRIKRWTKAKRKWRAKQNRGHFHCYKSQIQNAILRNWDLKFEYVQCKGIRQFFFFFFFLFIAMYVYTIVLNYFIVSIVFEFDSQFQ